MALMEIAIVPLGTGSTSLVDYVAEIYKELQKTSIPHKLTDMGTILEGNVEELLSLAGRLHQLPFIRGAKRVETRIVIDDRRDKQVHLDAKIAAVKSRLTEVKKNDV